VENWVKLAVLHLLSGSATRASDFPANGHQRAPQPRSAYTMSCSHHHGQSSATAGYPVSNPSAGAKWSKGLTQSRLGQFLGGHFSGENLSSALFTHKVDSEDHVKLSVWSAPGLSKPTFEEALKQKFTKAKKGDRFGPSCEYFVTSERKGYEGTDNRQYRGKLSM
jgi:hypothetical protein